MSVAQRIKSVLMGFLLFAIGLLMEVAQGEKMIYLVALFFFLALIVIGIRYIVFYFRMARHMIGGLNQLIVGFMLIDAALVFVSLSGSPNVFIALYLVGINVVSGGLTAYRALTQKKLGDKHWRLKLFRGALNVVLGICCLFYVNSADFLMMTYGLSLMASGVLRVVEAFRPTDVVYIQ